MKTKAAILRGPHQAWEIVELDLDEPGPGEVLVRMQVAGLCHSDEHLKYGGPRFPIVGGHEGAGVVVTVGPGVKRIAEGDHVACSWIPSCGACRWCLTGQGNLCDLGANMMTGELANGGYRYHLDGDGIGGAAATGTFSEYAVMDERSVVKVDPSLPFEWVSLVTCSVGTGWGSVVNLGNVKPGETVAVYGSGGIGINAVRAAVSVNAALVAVIDPVKLKRDFASASGADYVYATAEEAQADLWERTNGVGIDTAIITAGVVTEEIVNAAFNLIRKGGTIVLTGVANEATDLTVKLPGSLLTLFQKRIVGGLYGACNPVVDIPRMLAMAQTGKLQIDDLITKRYSLSGINEAFADMLNGTNIRGVIVY